MVIYLVVFHGNRQRLVQTCMKCRQSVVWGGISSMENCGKGAGISLQFPRVSNCQSNNSGSCAISASFMVVWGTSQVQGNPRAALAIARALWEGLSRGGMLTEPWSWRRRSGPHGVVQMSPPPNSLFLVLFVVGIFPFVGKWKRLRVRISAFPAEYGWVSFKTNTFFLDSNVLSLVVMCGAVNFYFGMCLHVWILD